MQAIQHLIACKQAPTENGKARSGDWRWFDQMPLSLLRGSLFHSPEYGVERNGGKARGIVGYGVRNDELAVV